MSEVLRTGTTDRRSTLPALGAVSMFLLAACGGSPGADGEGILTSLVAAERAFAAAAAQQGVREAFLANLADDAVLFRPRPVPGKQYLRGSAPTPGVLSWDPEYAEASADGSLGYTTGPWLYRPTSDAEPVASGRYLTFWRRDRANVWKAVIDHGIGGPVDAAKLGALDEVETRLSESARRGSGGDAKRGLQRSDSILADALGAPGQSAVAAVAAPDVRVLRDGFPPLSGPDQLGSGLPAGGVSFEAAGAALSAGGDLGYTYGEYEITPRAAGSDVLRGTYLRGWRADPAGGWRLAIDLMTPLPVNSGP